MPAQQIKLQEEQLRASDADLQAEEQVRALDKRSCPFSGKPAAGDLESTKEPLPYQYVPLRMGGNGGSHRPSEASRMLIDYEVSFDDLKRMTHKFYEFAFQDETLDQFIRSHSDPHGDRFAKWVHQKLTGSNIWDEDRRTRDLSPHEVAGGGRYGGTRPNVGTCRCLALCQTSGLRGWSSIYLGRI